MHGNFQVTDSDSEFNSRNPFAANKAYYLNRAFNETLSDSFAHKLSWTLNANQNTIDNDAIIHAVTLDPNTLTSVPIDQSVLSATEYSVACDPGCGKAAAGDLENQPRPQAGYRYD